MKRIRGLIPTTDLGRALLLGLVLIWAGITIALAPVSWPGPGLGLAIPGLILVVLTLITPEPPEAAE